MALSFFSIFNAFAGEQNQEKSFWGWFQKNEEMLFHFESDQEKTLDKLSAELKKVNPDLTFEFGPVENL